MPLIQCRECGKEISDQAESCPHCGFPMEKKGLNAVENQPGNVQQQSSKIAERPWRPYVDHMVIGIIMIVVSLYLTQSLLPDYAPPSEEKVLDSLDSGYGTAIKEGAKYYFFYTMTPTEQRDYRSHYYFYQIGSWTFGLLGLILFFSGISSRAKIGYCPTCTKEVVIKRTSFGMKCEICNTKIRTSKSRKTK